MPIDFQIYSIHLCARWMRLHVLPAGLLRVSVLSASRRNTPPPGPQTHAAPPSLSTSLSTPRLWSQMKRWCVCEPKTSSAGSFSFLISVVVLNSRLCVTPASYGVCVNMTASVTCPCVTCDRLPLIRATFGPSRSDGGFASRQCCRSCCDFYVPSFTGEGNLQQLLNQ